MSFSFWTWFVCLGIPIILNVIAILYWYVGEVRK